MYIYIYEPKGLDSSLVGAGIRVAVHITEAGDIDVPKSDYRVK